MEDLESKMNMRRQNHTVVERQRRCEQRELFDKLQVILQSDPRAPRLRLLSLVSATPCFGFPLAHLLLLKSMLCLSLLLRISYCSNYNRIFKVE